MGKFWKVALSPSDYGAELEEQLSNVSSKIRTVHKSKTLKRRKMRTGKKGTRWKCNAEVLQKVPELVVHERMFQCEKKRKVQKERER